MVTISSFKNIVIILSSFKSIKTILKAMPIRYAKTRDIERMYDADTLYDPRYKEIQFEKYDLLLANAERELQSKNSREDTIRKTLRGTVIDVGCGSGLLPSFFSARRLLGGMRYVGFDISGGMLAVARSKFAGKPNISLVRATADMLPLRDGVSNVVISISTYQNLDARQQSSLFEEITCILAKQKGWFLFSFLDKPPLSDKVETITKYLESQFVVVKLLEEDSHVEDRLFVCFDATNS